MKTITICGSMKFKIELSDAIYVVDIQGYIVEQVSKEIAYEIM